MKQQQKTHYRGDGGNSKRYDENATILGDLLKKWNEWENTSQQESEGIIQKIKGYLVEKVKKNDKRLKITKTKFRKYMDEVVMLKETVLEMGKEEEGWNQIDNTLLKLSIFALYDANREGKNDDDFRNLSNLFEKIRTTCDKIRKKDPKKMNEFFDVVVQLFLLLYVNALNK